MLYSIFNIWLRLSFILVHLFQNMTYSSWICFLQMNLILQNISKIFVGFALTNVKNMKNQASFIYIIFLFGCRNVSPSAKPIKLALKNISLVFFGSYLRRNELHIIMSYYWCTGILLILYIYHVSGEEKDYLGT